MGHRDAVTATNPLSGSNIIVGTPPKPISYLNDPNFPWFLWVAVGYCGFLCDLPVPAATIWRVTRTLAAAPFETKTNEIPTIDCDVGGLGHRREVNLPELLANFLGSRRSDSRWKSAEGRPTTPCLRYLPKG